MSANATNTAPKVRMKPIPLSHVVDVNPRFGKDELDEHSVASFIPMKCVEEESGRFQPLGDRTVAEVSKGYTSFRNGDVLFAKVTPCMENGKAAVMEGLTNGVGFGSTEFFVLRPKNDLEAKYLFHFILQSTFRKDAARNMTGAVGLRRVPKQWLEQQTIPLPDTAEQRRIVAEIEKQFTRLDAGVAALKRVQANLKRYRAAVLNAACEGKLVPTEVELSRSRPLNNKSQRTFESGADLLKRILEERRKNWTGRGKYKEPSAPDTANLPPLPEGWTRATADQLTDENRSITYGVIKLGAQVDDGVHVLRSSDVRHLRLDLENVKRVSPVIAGEYRRTFLKGGEVLITVRGTLGGVVVTPSECVGFNISREVAMLAMVEPAIAKIAAIFIGSAPLQRWLLQRAKGIAYTGINIETLKELPIPLPPLAEQTRIVAEVERRLSVVDELEAVVSSNLQRATHLRQSILQKAFTGELVAQEAEVVELPKVVAMPKPETVKKPNRHFARVVLSAEIVHRLHQEPTFGRIKHQKIFHLCEHIAQIEEIEGQYHREAAGPLDNRLIYANEGELKKLKWYQEAPRTGGKGHSYQPLAKAGDHRKYLESYWSDKLPLIDKLITLMQKWDTERCEIFCTAYAAWNDLILWGKEPTDDAILDEILNKWNPAKQRILPDRWRAAIGWMRKEGYVPTGFGKPTRKADL